MAELRTQQQVAQLMTERGYPMSRARVGEIEAKALRKMRKHPLMRELAKQLELLTRKD